VAVFFGSIPHSDLLKSVARRVVDRRVLHLIKMWLDCHVEETGKRGRNTRTTEARDKRRGIPIAGVKWNYLVIIRGLYHRQGRLLEEIEAWERASALLPYPAPELLALGYAELAAHHPQRGLKAFDSAVASLPPRHERAGSQLFFVSLARGQAMTRSALDQQH